jgi:hypothetical protein
MILELGETYVTHVFDPEEPNDGDIVKIVGVVDPSTIEYLRGFRYVGHNGIFYNELGYADYLTDSLDPVDPCNVFNIKRLAIPDDLKIAHEEYAWIDLQDCENNDKFITIDHPSFHMRLGGVYVDRRGMLKFINKAYRFNDTDLWGPDGGIRFISDKEGYTPSGLESEGRKSMYDIVYQKIG